jgi:hypothetical protein
MVFKQTALYSEMKQEAKRLERSSSVADTPASTVKTSEVSFERVLNSSIECSYFKRFAESEFCVEPLLFW